MNQDNQYHQDKRLNIAGKMARLFVKNSELNFLAMAFIVVWGIGSFILMPKAYNPEIVAPAFIITTDFPGASSDQVRELVSRPMEDVISQLPAIEQLSSYSFDGGRSIVMVQFEVGTAAEKAKISLVQKLRDNESKKPIGVNDYSIETLDPDDVPIISIALTSDIYPPQALRKFAFDVADELKLVEGTSKIDVMGGLKDELQIKLDSAKMASHNLAINDVVAILRATNGIYINEKVKNNEDSVIVKINGNISSAKDAENIILNSSQNKPIKLSDVAEISEGPGEILSSVQITKENSDSHDVAYVTIAKIKGSNISKVSEHIKEKIDEIKKRPQYSSVNFEITRNEGETASEEISTLTKHLALSILIVVIILMAFLGLRNSLIVAITIPLTLLSSFGVGLLAGQTVNRITLFALILALGLLVDDAIVIIENVHRTIKNNPGKNKSTLIIEAVNEVGMGVFMSTITILLAFIPMAFVSGMMGPYMGPIPFFVSTTLLISLLIAFTINPALTGIFSAHKSEQKENVFVKSIHKIEDKYARLIGVLITNKKKKMMVLYSALLMLVISMLLPLFKVVQFRMLPKADKQQFYVYLDMPTPTSFEKTLQTARDIEDQTLEMAEVESVETFVGSAPIDDFNGLFKGSFMRQQESQATLKINLNHPKNRNKPSEVLAMELREKINREITAKNADAKITLVEDPPGPPVRSTFFLKIQGDSQLLEETARDIEALASQINGVVDLKNSASQRAFEKQYQIDVEKALLYGITPAQIMETLHISLSGLNVARYSSSDQNFGQRNAEQHFVKVQLIKEDRKEIDDLSKINIRSNKGIMIPASELLIEKPLSKESMIIADERQKTFYVSAEMSNRSIMYAMLDLFPKLFKYSLPSGNGKIIDWSPLSIKYEDERGQIIEVKLDGEWKLTLEIFRDLGIAMGVALLLIYLVLVIQLRSLITPLLIMATIPLALIGVLIGFAILSITKGIYFNATSMIGVIALAGIVVKNAIIYLAYLDELNEKGMKLNEALMEAGRVRLLPILLTSLTAILGSLTIISDPVWEGLAWSIIFGLSVSTLLTLIIFPLLYQTFEGKKWPNR